MNPICLSAAIKTFFHPFLGLKTDKQHKETLKLTLVTNYIPQYNKISTFL